MGYNIDTLVSIDVHTLKLEYIPIMANHGWIPNNGTSPGK
jgi:hypothetical protein